MAIRRWLFAAWVGLALTIAGLTATAVDLTAEDREPVVADRTASGIQIERERPKADSTDIYFF